MNLTELRKAAEAAMVHPDGSLCEEDDCLCLEKRFDFENAIDPSDILRLLAVVDAAKEIHYGRLKEDCYPALRHALKALEK